MSTRLIELCFDKEEIEETIYTTGNAFFVVDPYLINVKDLEDLRPGKIVRLRRPAWGSRDIDGCIKRIEL
jgi:hypothetical protein